MSLSETIHPQQLMASSITYIDTISASIPFDYSIPTESPKTDIESTSSNGDVNNQTMNEIETTKSKNSRQFSSPEMIQLQNINVTEDEKLRGKDLGSDSNSYSSGLEVDSRVQLEVTAKQDSIVPRVMCYSSGEQYNMDDTESVPYLPPHVHIRLYRKKTQMTNQVKTENTLENNLNSEKSEISSSLPDLKSNKLGLQLPNLSKLRSRFQRSRSVPALNVVPEEKENQLESLECRSISLDDGNQTNPDRNSISGLNQTSPDRNSISGLNQTSPDRNSISGLKRMFVKNKRPTVNHSAIIAQHRRRVKFSPMDDVNCNDDDNNMSEDMKESSNIMTDNKKLENGENSTFTGSYSHFLNESIVSADGQENQVYKNDRNEKQKDTVIAITKKSHFRGGKFCTFLRKFTTVLPRDEIAERPVVVKDAIDVLPLDNGEAIVTDILSNKMVLFDTQGCPKITFAMENGSEPWSAVVTPENGSMAVTLKGDGCVCLWSPKGVSQTDFGHGILSSPTGIKFDSMGRFVISDEEKNSIFLFSRSGNFIGEFVNQYSLNPLAGNKAMAGFNQPRYIAVSRDGLYFVSDSSNQNVKVFDNLGNILRVIGSYGREDGQFRFPYGVAFDEETKLLYVADHYNHRVSVFSLTGTFLYHILTQEDGITRPKGLAICNSNLYVTFGNLRAGNISVYRIHANHDDMES